MRGLDIRCKFALELVINPYIKRACLEEALELLFPSGANPVRRAYHLGGGDYSKVASVDVTFSNCPTMFIDEPLLSEAWAAGYGEAKVRHEFHNGARDYDSWEDRNFDNFLNLGNP